MDLGPIARDRQGWQVRDNGEKWRAALPTGTRKERRGNPGGKDRKKGIEKGCFRGNYSGKESLLGGLIPPFSARRTRSATEAACIFCITRAR